MNKLSEKILRSLVYSVGGFTFGFGLYNEYGGIVGGVIGFLALREAMLKSKGVVIDGKYIPPIVGKGFIYDRYSCSCGFTDKSRWQAFIHILKNSSHKMVKN